MEPWSTGKDGVMLRVKADPKSRRPGICGFSPDSVGVRLRVAVSEAPEDGRANEAVCALIAKSLGVKAARVWVVSGESSRQKLLRIEGEAAPIITALTAICAAF